MTCPECRAEDFTGYLTGCPCCIAMRRVQVEKANFDFLMRAIHEPKNNRTRLWCFAPSAGTVHVKYGRKVGRPALRPVKARDEGGE